MPKKSKKPANRGAVNNIILEVLKQGDKYGYEIIKEVEEKTDGKIKLKQPSLYSSLTRFENKGIVSSYWENSAIGGKRHYYKLTDLGISYYESLNNKKYEFITQTVNINNKNKAEKIEQKNNMAQHEKTNNIINNSKIDNAELYNISTNGADYELDDELTSDEEYFTDKYISKFSSDKNIEINSNIKNNNFNMHENIAQNNTTIQNESSTIQNNTTIQDESPAIQNNTTIQDESSAIQNNTTIQDESSAIQNNTTIQDESPTIQNNTTIQNESSTIQNLSNKQLDNLNPIISNSNFVHSDEDESENSTDLIFQNVKFGGYSSSNYWKQNNYNNYEQPSLIEKEKRKLSMDKLYNNNKPEFETAYDSLNEKLYNKSILEENTNTINQLENTIVNYENNQNSPVEFQTAPKSNIIIDEFGIIKMSEDTEPISNEIIDNVKLRINSTDNNMLKLKTLNTNFDNKKTDEKENKDLLDLTDEEREERNLNFNKKFEKVAEQKINNGNLDYKNILGDLYTPENFENNIEETISQTKNIQNLKTLTNIVDKTSAAKEVTASIDNKLEENISVKHYKKEKSVSNLSSSYVLINKLKLIFGIILSLVMLVETTITLLIFQNTHILKTSHYTLFIISYILSLGILVKYLIPYLANSTKHKEYNFNLQPLMMFGSLAFLISIILIYAINSFLGLTFNNISEYIVFLVLPTILTFNFILGPIILKLLVLNKKFYD